MYFFEKCSFCLYLNLKKSQKTITRHWIFVMMSYYLVFSWVRLCLGWKRMSIMPLFWWDTVRDASDIEEFVCTHNLPVHLIILIKSAQGPTAVKPSIQILIRASQILSRRGVLRACGEVNTPHNGYMIYDKAVRQEFQILTCSTKYIRTRGRQMSFEYICVSMCIFFVC